MSINLQKIFDTAWQAFIIERKPPAQDGYVCKYKTEDGRRCAIGLSIPDGHSYEKLEMSFGDLLYHEYELIQRNSCDELLFDYALVELSIDASIRFELDEFQSLLHDRFAKNGEWIVSQEQMKASYIFLAKKWKLTIPEDIT